MQLFYRQSSIRKKLSRRLSRMSSMLVFGMLLSLTPNVGANASAEDVHEVAEICMLANRLLKDYALIGLGVHYHDPEADLKKGAKKIDDYMVELESHHLKAKLDAEIHDLDRDWKTIEPILLKKPDKKILPGLRKHVESFTKQCEIVAEHLAEDTKIKGEHDVVLIAQLGMEVQRLAALYMIKAWGADEPHYYEEVEEIKDEFEKIYAELMAEDEKLVSKEIKVFLKKVDQHFLLFHFMAKSKSGRYMPTRAEKIASEVFHEIREILLLEEELVE